MKPTIWHGCYDKSLKGFITDQSFGHPAKYSLGLIERIFDHCLQRGYLDRGDVVGDCFGGVFKGNLSKQLADEVAGGWRAEFPDPFNP